MPFFWWMFSLGCIVWPNKSVKGTRRPLAVLKFCFYQGSAASLKLSERRAPYRNVRLSGRSHGYRKMIVVVGGMIRSGSTFSFNIVRETLALRGSVEFASANSIDNSILTRAGNQHFVLKTHAPDEDILKQIKSGELACICTFRRPEEAIASWMRTFGFSLEHGIDSMTTWFSWYVTVAGQVLTIDHQLIERQPRLAIKKIIEYIDTEAESEYIDTLEEKYNKSSLKAKYDALANNEDSVDIGFSYYDKETFFHRRHISSNAPDPELSPFQIDQVRRELREYLKLSSTEDIFKHSCIQV